MSTVPSIALSVDVEDWYHIPSVTGSDFSKYADVDTFFAEWTARWDYLSPMIPKVLDILERWEIRATFFVVADVVERYPGVLDAILHKGHEIGCHGLHHAMNVHTQTLRPVFTYAEFLDRTGRARDILRAFSGQPVAGYRAPGGYIGRWMLDALAALGFTYDSSVHPNSFWRKADWDVRAVGTAPYWEETSGGRIVELPWAHFKAGITFPSGGGPILRWLPWWYSWHGIATASKKAPSVFYFHPIDLTPEKLPAAVNHKQRRPFYFATSGARTTQKLNRILAQGAGRWTTCEQVVHQFCATSLT